MVGWKKIHLNGPIATPKDSFFLGMIEEIEEKDLKLLANCQTKKERKRKKKEMELELELEENGGIDWSSFRNLDDFKGIALDDIAPVKESGGQVAKNNMPLDQSATCNGTSNTFLVAHESVQDLEDFTEKNRNQLKTNPKKRVKKSRVHQPVIQENPKRGIAPSSNWNEFNLHPSIVISLLEAGFKSPTKIQQETLAIALNGAQRDIIAASETGSGKTLAFGLPILNYCAEQKKIENVLDRPTPIALILVPTRELAIQVRNHLVRIAASELKDKIVCVVGGMSVQKQERQIKKGALVLVATPGRLWDVIKENDNFAQSLKMLKFLVLDEADRMLESGHFKNLDDIFGAIEGSHLEDCSSVRHTFVFSATMVDDSNHQQNLTKKSNRSLNDAKGLLFRTLLKKVCFRDKNICYINLSGENVGVAKGIIECKINCMKSEKDLMLYYILFRYPGKKTIVFVNSISTIRRIVPILAFLKFEVYGLHAEMQQKQRLKNLERFANSEKGCSSVLICSDVAARGLDIPQVNHVIQYHLPRSVDNWVHRSGRTGRGSDAEGVMIALVSPPDLILYNKICKGLGKPDGLSDFPMDTGVANSLQKRLALAMKLDKLSHSEKKHKVEKEWLKKAALDMDVDYTDSDGDSDVPRIEGVKASKKSCLQSELDDLIATPIIPRGSGINSMYITSNFNPMFASIAMASKGSLLPTLASREAVRDAKN